MELSLKSLQDKHDQLSQTHEEALEKIKEARRQSSSSRENEDFAEVLKKLEGESKAREEAVNRAEAAEHQCSMLKLDVKTSKEEITQLKQELASTRTKVCEYTMPGVVHVHSHTEYCTINSVCSYII